MAKLQVSINDVMQKTTMYVHVNVTGTRLFKVKKFFATKLIVLAAFILNCGIKIESKIDE